MDKITYLNILILAILCHSCYLHKMIINGLREKGGEGEMYRKSNMETYITICKIYSQWEFAVWLRKLKHGLCNNLEGWDVEGDGSEVQKGRDICILMADSC